MPGHKAAPLKPLSGPWQFLANGLLLSRKNREPDMMMPYVLAVSDTLTKHTKTAFLFQALAGLLEERGLRLHSTLTIESSHRGRSRPDNPATTSQDFAELANECHGLVLVSVAVKSRSAWPLKAVLDQQPDHSWKHKPVLLIVIGGLPSQAVELENHLRPAVRRLEAGKMISLVHLPAGNWIQVSDDRPRFARGSVKAVSDSLDLLLGCSARSD